MGKLSSVQEDTDEVRHRTFLWPRRLFYQSADFTTSLSCTNTIQSVQHLISSHVSNISCGTNRVPLRR